MRAFRLLCIGWAFGLVFSIVSVAAARPVQVVPGAARLQQFSPANGCGCHAALIDQWRMSMHSKALEDPLYLAKLSEANEATDGKLGAFCNTCHGPVATMTREIDRKVPGGAAAEGVTCMFCHQLTGNHGTPGNVSQVVSADGIRRAQLLDPQAPHPAAYSPFHRSAELCGGCHDVNHPVNGMHLEATYSEWKKSPYAAEGIVCQDCHMSREPGSVGPFTGQAAGGALQRDNIYKMSFVGAQVELGDPVAATALLKSAAVVTLEVTSVVPAGERAQVAVSVENKGAGHYLPTGLTEVREMYLEVVATDADGKRQLIGERRFGTVLRDAKGKFPAELWEAVAIQSDDRIPPRKAVNNTFIFTMPEGVQRAELSARLLYRSAPDELAKKAGVENPVTEMASAKRTVYASSEAKAQAQTPPKSSSSGEMWNLIVAIGGLISSIAIAGFFLARSRRTG